MQKVVQRRIAAEHQALRRAAKQKSKVDNAKEWNARWQAMSRGKQEGIYFKAEKHRRREEYEVGPQLAPRRDTGHLKETYGTVDPNVIQVPKLHWTQYKNFKSDFAVGDRVLVIKGKDAGKVGTVSEVSAESGFLRIIELRKVHMLNCERHWEKHANHYRRPTFTYPNTYARRTRTTVRFCNSQCPFPGTTSGSFSLFAIKQPATSKMSFWTKSTCAMLDG